MRFDHDPDVNAVYITIRDVPYSWGHDLDHRRRMDFGADNKPMGIELLNVSAGVNLEDLPERDAVARLLREHGIPVLIGARAS